ncbi:transcriptional regulatory protein AlgP-like [Homalodisca vitripennis]|uniref:transcriptional regulatory protein AlgP-like n=1 Tax=Homalodisca vitripennis TaxID=197043 RepID=UPI001EEABF28|nr:transcriptional regulatory protein AlgP-like [Homalodisca vitripennis]
MYTSTVLTFSLIVGATLAATPFFESPHNERASAFYKTPAHGGFSHPGPVVGGSVPAYKPQAVPAYKPQAAPAYKPQVVPAHRPQAAPAYKPQVVSAYRPQAAPAYKPQVAPAYKPKPSYGGGYNQGATSFQSVRLEVGEQAYRSPQKSHY